jgi:hypothetical protein
MSHCACSIRGLLLLLLLLMMMMMTMMTTTTTMMMMMIGVLGAPRPDAAEPSGQ